MITKLTKEHNKLIDEINNKWLSKVFDCKTKIDKEKLKRGVRWMYGIADLPEPEIIICPSPTACQAEARRLTGNNVYHDVGWRGSISDYNTIAYFDFFEKVGVVKDENFNQWRSLTEAGMFQSIQFNTHCICCEMPIEIHRNNEFLLHNPEGMAIKWKDGYGLYFWRGVAVEEKIIMHPESITKEEILQVDNAEVRRCHREILGANRYYDIISDGKGLTVVDEDTDNQGYTMKLYETTLKDKVINKVVQFLEVIDPSTGRVYNIYPTKDGCTNVWDAKASTFGYQKIQYRQGDVGLLNIDKDYEHPEVET